jgi:hemolysin III
MTAAVGVDRVPAWRGWLHVAGFVAAVPAGVALVAASPTLASRLAVAVYVVALAGLFATSATYHRFVRSARAKTWWRRADHSMIFVLIAATYTPICLVGLPARWAVPFLVVVWAAALLGVVLKLGWFDGAGRRASLLYGVIGWAAVLLVPVMVASLDAPVLALIAGGGVCYTAGAVVLARNTPNPAPATFGYHEVWHSATLLAAGLHFAGIAMLVA